MAAKKRLPTIIAEPEDVVLLDAPEQQQQKQRRRTRVSSKIDRLPPEIKQQVDDMMLDNTISFQEISDWLKEMGFDISRGAVGRYSLRKTAAAERLAENLEQTKVILDWIERNPNIDPAKAAQMALTSGLMQRISTADEEYLEMPLDKAGRLLTSLRRVDVAERKLVFDMRSKIDLAFEQLENQIMDVIKHDPVLSAQLRDLLTKAKGMIADE